MTDPDMLHDRGENIMVLSLVVFVIGAFIWAGWVVLAAPGPWLAFRGVIAVSAVAAVLWTVGWFMLEAAVEVRYREEANDG